MVFGGAVPRGATSFLIPCGQCVRCRLERSRGWAVRCMHEASLHQENCFITLTYNDANLPEGLSLRHEDFQGFMKRLRSRFFSSKIRYYMCGEYGENTGRPHYHALLFNFDFADKLYFKRVGDNVLYTSRVLSELWPLGHSLIGSVTFESAAYVARYCVQQVTGKAAKEHYRVTDASTGEIFERRPEYNKMSLKPGIGAEWFARFADDVYPADKVISRGKEARPPRYYDVLLGRQSERALELLKEQRRAKASLSSDDESLARRETKELVAKARLSLLNRKLK